MKILSAEQMALTLESTLFASVREAIAAEIGAVQQNAMVLKTADALLSLAQVARKTTMSSPPSTRTACSPSWRAAIPSWSAPSPTRPLCPMT